MKQNRGVLFLIMATLFWGTTFSFTKYLLEFLDPLTILFIRFFISSLIVLIIFYKKIRLNIFKIFKNKIFIIFALLHFFAYYLQTEGLKYTSASNTAFITAFSCLMVPLLNFLHFKTKVSKVHTVAVVLALIGIYILSYSFNLPQGFNLGDLLVFVSALMYAYFIIIMSSLSKKYSTSLIVFYLFFTTSMCSLFFNFGTKVSFSFIFDFKALVSIILLTIFGTIMANLLVTKGQSMVNSEKAALIYTMEPIVAVVFAVIFIGEIVTLNLVVGSILVLVGILASIIFDKPSS